MTSYSIRLLTVPSVAAALFFGLGTGTRAQELMSAVLPSSKSMAEVSLPRIGLFTTGGTIQSKGEHRQKLMEYGAGRVTPDELLADLPELADIAEIEVTEISNIGSGGITQEHQLELAKAINAWLARPDTTGAVVTHGTGTLEETAYFLNLTIGSEKPVVVVGAMRPFTAVSRDGPFNLYNAMRVAASPEARDMGVLILLNDEINAARDTTKSNTYRMETFVARDLGPLGYAGSLTPSQTDAVERAKKKGVVVVATARTQGGRVQDTPRRRSAGIVPGDNLLPEKARILLQLALATTRDSAEIGRIFGEY